jgi:vancomycin aglycone glucosyltransferase
VPSQETTDLDVVRTGAWILPDERPSQADLEALLDAGTPPVYMSFGNMRRVPQDTARVAIEAIRAHGRRALLAHGWADLALIDDRDECFAVGEVNQQALFGRVVAVVHHGRRGHDDDHRSGRRPSGSGAPGGGPALLGRPGGRPGHRRGPDGPTPTTESLSAAVRMTLTPKIRARATAVAGTIRTDGATVAARLLLDALA